MQLTYTDNSDIMKKNATIKISSINVSVDPYTISMMKHVADTASKALQVIPYVHSVYSIMFHIE